MTTATGNQATKQEKAMERSFLYVNMYLNEINTTELKFIVDEVLETTLYKNTIEQDLIAMIRQIGDATRSGKKLEFVNDKFNKYMNDDTRQGLDKYYDIPNINRIYQRASITILKEIEDIIKQVYKRITKYGGHLNYFFNNKIRIRTLYDLGDIEKLNINGEYNDFINEVLNINDTLRRYIKQSIILYIYKALFTQKNQYTDETSGIYGAFVFLHSNYNMIGHINRYNRYINGYDELNQYFKTEQNRLRGYIKNIQLRKDILKTYFNNNIDTQDLEHENSNERHEIEHAEFEIFIRIKDKFRRGLNKLLPYDSDNDSVEDYTN